MVGEVASNLSIVHICLFMPTTKRPLTLKSRLSLRQWCDSSAFSNYSLLSDLGIISSNVSLICIWNNYFYTTSSYRPFHCFMTAFIDRCIITWWLTSVYFWSRCWSRWSTTRVSCTVVMVVLYDLMSNCGNSLAVLVRVRVELHTSGNTGSDGGWRWGVARTTGSSVV